MKYLLFLGSKEDAYNGKIPVAFLNRFEKQVIDRRQLMRNNETASTYVCIWTSFQDLHRSLPREIFENWFPKGCK